MGEALIVDRENGRVSIWNLKEKRYFTFSFEAIEDLAIIIKQEEDIPGIIYEPIPL